MLTGVLDLRSVGVTKGRKRILESVSCQFLDGLTYLIGLNGSGKTTLLRCLAGIAPYEGNIFLRQKELRAYGQRSLARRLAFVQQHINLPAHIQTYDFVLMGRYPYLNWWGTYRAFDRAACRAAMERLEVWPLRERRLTEISGGELQRVLLARALTQD
ncbi:MAG: ABC transporter ATP-binding protein, partial [Bacteroidetes bacterium]